MIEKRGIIETGRTPEEERKQGEKTAGRRDPFDHTTRRLDEQVEDHLAVKKRKGLVITHNDLALPANTKNKER